MEHLKRKKATKAQKKATKKARKADYAKMVVAASEVVMRNRGNEYRSGQPEYVLMEFPYWVKFEEGFPKGHIVSKTLNTNIHKVNAVKLLDWLYKKGHSSYDSGMLVKQTKQFEVMDKAIDRMFDQF